MIEAIGVIVTILFIAICLGYLISSINYVIDEQYLRIRVWAFTFRKISISDFEGAEVGVTIGGENWTNTIYMPTIRKKGVTLHRRSGLFRRLNITPSDPVGFVESIKSHPLYMQNS
jgi:hypothetical protein